MKIGKKLEHVANLEVEGNKLYVIDQKGITKIAKLLGMGEDELIYLQGIVECKFDEDGEKSLDRMLAITTEGETAPVYVLGLPEGKFLRFLNEGEKSLAEYWEAKGIANCTREQLEEVISEYKELVLSE